MYSTTGSIASHRSASQSSGGNMDLGFPLVRYDLTELLWRLCCPNFTSQLFLSMALRSQGLAAQEMHIPRNSLILNLSVSNRGYFLSCTRSRCSEYGPSTPTPPATHQDNSIYCREVNFIHISRFRQNPQQGSMMLLLLCLLCCLKPLQSVSFILYKWNVPSIFL